MLQMGGTIRRLSVGIENLGVYGGLYQCWSLISEYTSVDTKHCQTPGTCLALDGECARLRPCPQDLTPHHPEATEGLSTRAERGSFPIAPYSAAPLLLPLPHLLFLISYILLLFLSGAKLEMERLVVDNQTVNPLGLWATRAITRYFTFYELLCVNYIRVGCENPALSNADLPLFTAPQPFHTTALTHCISLPFPTKSDKSRFFRIVLLGLSISF